MASEKRPPRIPFSPEEVQDFIKLKNFRERAKIEKFKRTKIYKVLNAFNVISIIIYTEIIFAFLGSCNFSGHYVLSTTVYYDEEIKGGKRAYSTAVFKMVNGEEYDVSIHDTCPLPAKFSKIYIGQDWLLKKYVKIRFEQGGKDRFVRRSFPLLFISVLWGFVTFVLFGYNLNQTTYSLSVITFINSFSLICFLLL